KLLAELCDQKRDYFAAYDAYKTYKDLENDDINLKRTLNLERLQIEYEMDLKDKEIEFLHQKKSVAEEKLGKNKLVILLVIISLVLVIFTCVFLIFYNRSLRRSKELSDSARIMQ